MPGRRFDVIDATESQVPTSPEVMSYGILTEPPAVGPVALTPVLRRCWPAPTRCWHRSSRPGSPRPSSSPEPGSPELAFPSGPYAIVSCSLAGPCLRRGGEPDLEGVRRRVAEVLDALPVDDDPPLRTRAEACHVDRPAPAAEGFRSVQIGAITLFGRAAFGKPAARTRCPRLCRLRHHIAVRDDADPACIARRHSRTSAREVRDRVVADAAHRSNA